MLDARLSDQLRTHLQKLQRPVRIHVNLGADPRSLELRALLDQVVSLSDRLEWVEGGPHAPSRTPSFAIAAADEPPRVRFAAIPLGHEFTSFVLALLQVGGHPPRIDAEQAARIAALPADPDGMVELTTYVSLSCQNCPDVVQALNLVSVLNPGYAHTMVDGALFRSEVEDLGILAVPSIVTDGKAFAQGAMTLDRVLELLERRAATHNQGAEPVPGAAQPSTVTARVARAAAESQRAPYDVLIVGGGPAGGAAAIYAARKGIRTALIAQRFGGQVMDTLAIENYASVEHTEGPRFVAALERQVRGLGVDVLEGTAATALLGNASEGFVLELGEAAGIHARTVVLAPGARWRELGVPGEQEYRNRGVAYCPHCDGPLFKGKRVAVIGGGNSGVEAAIDLAGIVEHVTLLEYAAQLRADEVLQRKLRSLPNVRVVTSAQTTAIQGDGRRVTGIAYTDRSRGDSRELQLAGVFVQIGLVPNTDWLGGVVETTRFGEIVVDAAGRTSLPGVFAAGDATTTPYKQIGVAAGDGAKAALSAFDHLIRQVENEAQATALAA